MYVALDQLDSLWPPHRGAVLLGAARESQGRVRNTGLAVTAGHVALSLRAHPPSSAAGTTTAAEGGSSGGTQRPSADGPELAGATAVAAVTDVDGGVRAPATVSVGQSPTSTLSLTILLDAVPASAPTPGTHQMAKFLTKVLSRTAGQDAGHSAAPPGLTGRRKGVLGEDLPEMLVVEHQDEVICSEFVRFNHGLPTRPTVAGGGASTGTGSNSLVYACIEANGLLRLWEWGGSDTRRWSWSYLNSCNICACREDPIGCRVLTAAIVPEPDGNGDDARHRLVWEQEDSGEGAGLGLASTPAAGPRTPRRVWSRRITFDVAEGGAGSDGLWSGDGQSGAGFGKVEGVNSPRLEISLAFSACLLPTGVDTLLCSRFGAWMSTGARVYFNHFATGRLPCIVLRSPVTGDRGHGRRAAAAKPTDDGGSGSFGRDVHHGANTGESDAFADAGSGPGAGEPTPRGESVRDAGQSDGGGETFADGTAGDEDKPPPPFSPARRLFAVHDASGDLMIYDHHPRATVHVLSLPLGGGGGLALRRQCTLESSPPAPRSFAVRSNLAVFTGGGACSVYDLCTGRLLGRGFVPRCPACSRRRRQLLGRTASASSLLPELACACGRRQGSRDSEPSGGRSGDAEVGNSPVLWTSATRGHLVGVLTATHVLRVALPRMGACLAAMLAPCPRAGNSSQPSAPSTLRYLLEYKRLVGGPAGGARESSLLPALLQMVQQQAHHHTGNSEADKRTAMMGLLGQTLAADDRGKSGAAATTAGGVNGKSGHDESLPPWLLLAMVSAAQNHGRQGGAAEEAGGVQGCSSGGGGGGDPATAAVEAGLREALELRVSESLRSISSVRALLQDPVGSARRSAADAGRGGWRSYSDEEAASKLAAMTAGVDPATALFEGTLREWLACRRKGKGEAALDEDSGGTGGGQWAGSGWERAAAPGAHAGETGMDSDDAALALAFRCEVAGDRETTEIPFLHFLLEDSGWAEPGGGGDSGREKKRGGGGGGGSSGLPAPSSPSSSTFLCLQLAGDDASPLFEIACRALFRLQPRRLPRFVERLARFRAYADDIKERERMGGTGAEDGPEPPTPPHGLSDDEEEEGAENRPSFSRRERRRASWSSVDARSERTAGYERGCDGWRQDSSSTLAADDRCSPSPPPLGSAASRRTSEDSSFDRGGRAGRAAMRTISIGTSRDHSPEAPAATEAPPALASTTPSLSGDTDGGVARPTTGYREGASTRPTPDGRPPRKSVPVAPAYFARALACLPPASEDLKGDDAYRHERRRARLSLLLGACMFTEACRLLRSRAWEGSGDGSEDKLGGWRADRGAAEAWGATVRLLNELSRAAARDAEAAAAAAGTTPGAAAEMGAADKDDEDGSRLPEIGVRGRVSLQFRLAFEDMLAETILADSPERMRAVMLCRPSGLTPVAVVRMVRRAAKAATTEVNVASACTADGVGGGDDDGEKVEASPPRISGSTQTLKMCLLMLLEGGMGQRASAV